ncbi:hypothetical protein AADEFJLK_00413 [Methylovulum psychrotolerans]|uniref:Uncharacterized protein n=1 Tax=Methylovulum psychrotolerans TaxID=1704499 RepID=A0A2S5CRD7_9GAMM|nr:hypothetical protein AADEFJLK_00413 [Methylovulum psychrotolerans]
MGIKQRVAKLEAANKTNDMRCIPLEWMYNWGCEVPPEAFERVNSLPEFYDRARAIQQRPQENPKD